MTTPQQRRTRFNRVALASSLMLGACTLPMGIASVHAAEQNTGASLRTALIRFDIPAQSLDSAVIAFAEQAKVQVFFDSRKLAGLRSAGLSGEHSAEDGLAILLQDNPVRYRFSGNDRVGLERLSGDGKSLELNTTSIRSQGDGDWVYTAPRSVSVITRDQIDKRPPRHAADMLEETAGVYTAVNQRDPGLSVNIRGVQDYGRVNMNIDGMRQNFNVNGHQQRNGIMVVDPEFISSVEIEKGSQSGMGGAGVLGGIASFNTVQASEFLGPDKEYGGRIRAGHGIGELGNGTYFNGSALFAFGNEVGDLLLGVSERHFGDYRAGTNDKDNLGTQIRAREVWPKAWNDWVESEVGDMGSVTRSRLFKVGVNLPQDQRVQFNYIETDTDSKDSWTWFDYESDSFYYQRSGATDLNAKNASIDYSFSPDNDLIDVKAKVYFVRTRMDRWNAGSTASIGSGNWYGAYNDRFQTDTWGLQLQNTSRFYIGATDKLTLDYGTELFQDEFKPATDRVPAVNEQAYPYVQGATPEGKKLTASLFAQAQYEHDDWLTLDAGLRYDRYRLSGESGMTLWMFPEGPYEAGGIVKSQQHLIFDETTEQGRFSPTFGIAVKPGVDWLQLYTRWGRGWRAPAVTEVFMTGRPHAGGGAEMVYPNPYLKPETSHDWELGFNIFKESLLRDGDRFGLKVAYFDTRIDNFSFLDVNVSLPDETASGIGLGRMAYQNNEETTRFRGVEYSLDYDAGRYYGRLSYTHMIGTNDFCSQQFYMGGAKSTVRVGTVTRAVQVGNRIVMRQFAVNQAVPNDAMSNQINCGNIMGNATYMPADRGSLTLGMRFLDNTLDVGTRLRYSKGNGANLDTPTYATLDQAVWPKYKVYDLFASYWMTPQVNLTLALENATDQAYFVAMGDVNNLSLARGRTLSGMLEYKF
nr:TonB-dependent hemoglobin/transferrin/lactoferrin family receptor [Pseudomonas huaxiensis]